MKIKKLKVVRYDDVISEIDDEKLISEKMMKWFDKLLYDVVLNMGEGEDFVVLKSKGIVIENSLEDGWLVWDYVSFKNDICMI